jgi:hypothetical protein
MSMVRFSARMSVGALALFAAVSVAPVDLLHAADPADSQNRMNCGAQIECVTPDGHLGRITRLAAQDPGATALIMDDDTVSCVLQEGETNFVIELPDVAVPDRFTFLNENGKAHGELTIAVSNRRLAPKSADWKEVEGVIPFSHKRLFGVSLLGIEAKYVRLSFRVETQSGMAKAESVDRDQRLTANPTTDRGAAIFSSSALNDALNSTLAPETRPAPVLLGSIVSSVAPLRLGSN